MHKVTIIIPCLNEEKYIVQCLRSVSGFAIPEGWEVCEILVLDGGSTDTTVDLIRSLAKGDPRIHVVHNPYRYQSAAMNIGVKRATGEYILRLDAHASYPDLYLKRCAEASLATDADNTGGIVLTLPGGTGYGANVVQAMTTHRFGVGNSGFRTGAGAGWADTVPYGFFKKAIFSKIGFFDQRLVRAQDYELNRRIAVSGGLVWRDPSISVSYYNQPEVCAFFSKQFFREAPYNAYMWHLAPYSFAFRHAITALFTAGVLAGLCLLAFPIARFAFLAIMSIYFSLAIAASIQQAKRYKQPRHVVALPACFFVYHFGHGLGVIWGIILLLAGKAPVQCHNEPWRHAGQYHAWPPPNGRSWDLNLSPDDRLND